MSLNGKTATKTEEVISNSASIWPDISVQNFIDNYRLPAEFLVGSISQELSNAVRVVNGDLLDARSTYESIASISSLEELGGDEDEGKGLVALYKRAVMCYARGRLTRFYETLNRKEAAEVQGDRGDELVNHWQHECNLAIDALALAFIDKARELGASDDDLGEFAAGIQPADGFLIDLL